MQIVDSNHAVLKAPQSFSDKKVMQFLNSKQQWLDKTAQKLRAQDSFADMFDFDKFVYLNGEKVMPTSQLALGFDEFSNEKKKKIVKKFYLGQFENLKAKVQQISQRCNLAYAQVQPLSSVRVWGNFSTKKVMKLNLKLLVVPPQLQEYVICHELCHGLFMNHSPKFWAALEKVCPNCRALRKQLSEYAFLLKEKF